MSNEDKFVIACWDWMRKLRPTQPTGPEFDLCDCRAESLLQFCHHEFERNLVQKQQSQARHGRKIAHHATRG